MKAPWTPPSSEPRDGPARCWRHRPPRPAKAWSRWNLTLEDKLSAGSFDALGTLHSLPIVNDRYTQFTSAQYGLTDNLAVQALPAFSATHGGHLGLGDLPTRLKYRWFGRGEVGFWHPALTTSLGVTFPIGALSAPRQQCRRLRHRRLVRHISGADAEFLHRWTIIPTGRASGPPLPSRWARWRCRAFLPTARRRAFPARRFPAPRRSSASLMNSPSTIIGCWRWTWRRILPAPRMCMGRAPQLSIRLGFYGGAGLEYNFAVWIGVIAGVGDHAQSP